MSGSNLSQKELLSDGERILGAGTCREVGLLIPTTEVKFIWVVVCFMFPASILGSVAASLEVLSWSLFFPPAVPQGHPAGAPPSAGMICSGLALQPHSQEEGAAAVSPRPLGLILSPSEGRRKVKFMRNGPLQTHSVLESQS